MSRTIAQIYDQLNVVKGSMTELASWVEDSTGNAVDNAARLAADVNSGSKVSIWRLWLWLMAVATWIIENITEKAEASLRSIIDSKQIMNLNWFASSTLSWQYGHALEWLGDHWGYLEADLSAKIVGFSAASESNDGIIQIKALKSDRTILSTLQISSLQAFWAKFKPAGVRVQILSLEQNWLNIQAKIVRDRNVLNDDNTLIRDASINPLQIAVDGWIDLLPLDGKVRISDIESAAKSAEGIIDFSIDYLWIDDGEAGQIQVDRETIPVSGFAYVDWDLSDFTYPDE